MLQKTYTVDYLTKEVRKNDGEVRQYLVEHSHDPIISPEDYERVQRELKRRERHSAAPKCDSPLAGKLICESCGCICGHKVWHNRANTRRYNVWYCTHRYNKGGQCQSPVLRESEIHVAFEKLLQNLGIKNAKYSGNKWLELVENVTVCADKRLVFRLTDGREAIIVL